MRNNPTLYPYVLVLVFIFGVWPLFAQNGSGTWYFGSSPNGIRFNFPNNDPTTTTSQNGAYGAAASAVALDPLTGNLLFYTDGNTIYDATHQAMPGTGLGGDITGNQTVAITPIPGDPDRYYVFTINAVGDLGYAVVNIALDGNGGPPQPALGDVETATTSLGFPAMAEGMTIIPHTNGTDYWLITHEQLTGTFHVTLIDANPLGTVTAVTPSYSFTTSALEVDNMAYHEASGKIAMVPGNAGQNVFIMDFDPATGTITFNAEVVANSASTVAGGLNDAEWSPSGQYLYISRNNNIIQWDITNPALTLIPVLPSPGVPPIAKTYGIQTGPDSLMYYLYESAGNFYVGSLADTDSLGTNIIVTQEAFPGTNFNGTQFPVFLPASIPPNVTLSFSSTGSCLNTPINFFPTIDSNVDSLVWDFGSGVTLNTWSPIQTFTASGGTVTVTAYQGGVSVATSSQPLTLNPFDVQLTLVQDTVACICEYKAPTGSACNGGPFTVTAESQGGSAPTYQWYGPSGLLVGQNALDLVPDSAGYYYVVATEGGCSVAAGVNIRTYDSLDQRSNFWYFGANAGIDFNPPLITPGALPVAVTGPVNSPEGAATISDRNGQVIFSTDGQTVYDATGAAVPGDIGGDPGSTQSAIIVPVPDDETLYYIFTTQEVYGTNTYELHYAIFDTKLDPIGNSAGGLVDLDVSTPGTLDASLILSNQSTERITGNGSWIITHDYGNNCFRAFQISSTGISAPVVSCVGSDHSYAVPENGQGYMKLGGQNLLAVTLSEPGISNVLELFDFVDTTGVVTNFRTVDLGAPQGDSQAYGVEFGSAEKIFVTVKSTVESQIVEIVLDSDVEPSVLSVTPMSYAGELGAIQIAPDGQVYVAINNSSTLGVIMVNGDPLVNSTFNENGITLAGGTNSTLGLPNFIQSLGNPRQTPSLLFTGTCVNSPTDFFATGKEQSIDIFNWDFGDGTAVSDGGPQIAHTYTQPGTYDVEVEIINKCELVAIIQQTITINDVPFGTPYDPTLAPLPSFALCNPPETLDANPTDVLNWTYLWSNGATTETISISQIGAYSVEITNEFGCTDTAPIDVFVPFTMLDLGLDSTVCTQPGTGLILNTNINAASISTQWTISTNNGPDVPASTTSQQTVDFTIPGSYEYKVIVSDAPIPVGSGCVLTDSVTFLINETPAVTITNFTPPSGCGSADGDFEFRITQPSPSTFKYFVNGFTTPIFADDGDTPDNVAVAVPNPPVLGVQAGTYLITAIDNITQCVATQTFTLNDGAYTVDAMDELVCDEGVTNFTITPITGPPPVAFAYTIFNTLGDTVDIGTTNPTTLPLPVGDYQLQVTVGGCVIGDTYTLSQGPQVPLGFTNNLCINQQLTVQNLDPSATFTLFDWSASDPGSVASGVASSTITVNEGTWDLTVLATDDIGNCPTDTTFSVTVDRFTPDFMPNDECQDLVRLTATPTGPYIHRWSFGGTFLTTGSTLDITQTGLYNLQVESLLSGCSPTSIQKTVNVYGEIGLSLNSPTVCEGEEFTITATVNPGQTVTNYEWRLEGNLINGQTSPIYQSNEVGRYTVKTGNANCKDEAEIDITQLPVTPGLLPNRETICNDPENFNPDTRSVLLDPGTGFFSYQWYLNNSLLPGETNQTIIADQLGDWSVEMINFSGCPTIDVTEVEIECIPDVRGPNAFRPLGLNSEFFLFTFFIAEEDFTIFIFNRWGEMVYQSDNPDFRWNGGYNNNASALLPPGTYSYVVKYKGEYNPEDGIHEKRGGVVLIR